MIFHGGRPETVSSFCEPRVAEAEQSATGPLGSSDSLSQGVHRRVNRRGASDSRRGDRRESDKRSTHPRSPAATRSFGNTRLVPHNYAQRTTPLAAREIVENPSLNTNGYEFSLHKFIVASSDEPPSGVSTSCCSITRRPKISVPCPSGFPRCWCAGSRGRTIRL